MNGFILFLGGAVVGILLTWTVPKLKAWFTKKVPQ